MSTRQPETDAAVVELVIDRARRGDEQAFREMVEPLRRELLVHCYRMLGSVPDAEDMVQESLLAAWRGIDRFEGRASLRSWLFRIATNRCLNALRSATRRPHEQTTGIGSRVPPSRHIEPTWLEPYPDALLDGIPDQAPEPDARYEHLESIRLAFVVALQQLPPRQRAVLVLRDVVGFRAAEVAEVLDTTESAVTSALKRARQTLARHLSQRGPGDPPPAHSPGEVEIAGRFAAALASGDVDGLVALLTDDARLTMPPDPVEYEGPAVVAAFLRERCTGRGMRLVPTRANGQPAFGCYVRDPQAPIARAYGLLVVTLDGDRISAITRFVDSSVYPYFGLPRTLPE
jgi:RNA polymerase sigma-70 factor (TIGR02960 family)